MENLKARVDELADLMEQFQLSQAELAGDQWRIAFKKRSALSAPILLDAGSSAEHADADGDADAHHAPPQGAAAPIGVPVSSPMTGIFYTSSSPSAPPFVKEGEPVTAGQVVGLIEAMKVFNEIIAPTSGRVTQVIAASGQLVNPGDPLLYIG